MGLIELWKNARDQLEKKGVAQIIAFAGTGHLKDSNTTSGEFRGFLSHVGASHLGAYANECLDKGFKDSGFALQDLVNEIGRRLGFAVTDGRYRGKPGEVGFDGLWRLADGHAIIVEVKTTDAYRIDLDTLATYRRKLAAKDKIDHDRSSILVVVGRNDTGDLEAQIRGSRWAWDMRLISVESLLTLMNLKEDLEDPDTLARIHKILIPREFTRLDEIVSLVFSTAEEVKHDDDESPVDEVDEEQAPEVEQVQPKRFTPVSFHAACVARVEKALGQTFVKRTRSGYSTPDDSTALVCAVSKKHNHLNSPAYWFALHPHQKEFLAKHPEQRVALGCGSPATLLLVPLSELETWLEDSWTTERDGRTYWHIRIREMDGHMKLNLRKGVDDLDITDYLLAKTPET